MGDVCKYGEASVTGRTNTREYDAGYEAAFGPSKDEIKAPKRTTYVYRRIDGELKCIEVGGPEDLGPEDAGEDARLRIVSDLYMVGTKVDTVEGPVDIGSRRKRREYMASRDLVDVDDYKNEWAAAAKKREAVLSGEHGKAERRYQIGKALYEASKKR